MPSNESIKHDTLRAALGAGEPCPPLEDILRAVNSNPLPVSRELSMHLQSCAKCQTEIDLWQRFESTGDAPVDEDVRRVLKRLDATFPGPAKPLPTVTREHWWNRGVAFGWLVPVSLAAACLLLVVGAVVKYRESGYRPALNGPSQLGEQVFRSGSLTAVGPLGDVQERPAEIRWQSMQAAAKYRVSVLEVDRTELWTTETTTDRVELPAKIQDQIVPAKTLFYEVTAFDSSGSKIGETGLVRFRVLRNSVN